MAPIHAFDLVDLGGVDVEVGDESGVAGEFGRIAGHAVVEAGAEREQAIAVIDGVVRERRAVHSQHAHRQRLRRIHGPDPHQGGDRRHLKLAGKLPQRMRRVAVDDAAARIDERAFRGAESGEEIGARRLGHFTLLEAIHPLPETRHRQAAGAVEYAFPVLHVLGDVEHHRTRAARAGDLERRAHRRFEFGRIGDQENVLGDGTHDAGHGRLLKRIGADGRGRHLAADHDGRHGIGHAIAHRRDHVGRSRPGRHQRHSHPAAGARETGGHESRALFIGRHDQRHRGLMFLVVAEYGVVDRQDRAAAVSENRVDALVGQHLDQHFRTRHAGACQRMCGLI